MKAVDLENYNFIEGGGSGFVEQRRGLIAVWGKEAVQFLNGLLTNDVAKLESFRWMSAAFPNAQGRLLATVRVLKIDEKFLFETEAATHEKVFQNLFRFTFAGDFFVEDLSENFSYLSVFGNQFTNFKYKIPTDNEIIGAQFFDDAGFMIRPIRGSGFDIFVPKPAKEDFANDLRELKSVEISGELYEVLRVERGIPLYGVDMDETTIVPELGIDNLISYNKGCYIGQEIIARIHFRGHIAKQLTGLLFADANASVSPGDELKSPDGKNAGKITSITFAPKLEKTIALGFVRYDYLAEGTALQAGDSAATVKNLPFV
jgi:folate-binding protein YgfZ